MCACVCQSVYVCVCVFLCLCVCVFVCLCVFERGKGVKRSRRNGQTLNEAKQQPQHLVLEH